MALSSSLFKNKQIEQLVYWKEPRASAAVVGSATLAFFLSRNMSLAWLLSTLSLAVVVVSLFWSQAGAWLKSKGPPVPSFMLEGISEEEARKVAELVRPPVNRALSMAGRVLCGRDVQLSSKIAGSLTLASYIFSYLSVSTVAYAALMAAFTVPVLYDQNQTRADALGARGLREGRALLARVGGMLGQGLKKTQ